MKTLKESTKHINAIKYVLHEQLDQENVSSNFEGLWEDYTMKRNGLTHKKLYKAIILVAAITSISITTIYAGERLIRRDFINMPFKSDKQILGRWESVDFVPTIADFDVNKQNFSIDDLYLRGLVFEEDGIVHNLIENSVGDIVATSSAFTWTKHYILEYADSTASKYFIKTINDDTYMFMEWKNGDYTYCRVDKPLYLVLKKQ